MNYDRPDLLDRLAAEYVLGTMSARVRRRFQSVQIALPAAGAAVLAWERRLSPLAQSVPAVQPAAATWQAIERRIGASDRGARTSGWFRWWGPALGALFGVIATLGVVRLYPDNIVPIDRIVQERGTLPQSYVGLLTDRDGKPVVLASATRHGLTMSIKVLRKIEIPAGKVAQLWAFPTQGEPFPLGTVPREGKGTFQMSASSEKLLSNVPRLGVSIEEAPARPGATPGAMVLTGNCVKLW